MAKINKKASDKSKKESKKIAAPPVIKKAIAKPKDVKPKEVKVVKEVAIPKEKPIEAVSNNTEANIKLMLQDYINWSYERTHGAANGGVALSYEEFLKSLADKYQVDLINK